MSGSTLEQRKRLEAQLGNHVRGYANGQLRVVGELPDDSPPVCERCGGPLPCAECDAASAERSPQRRSAVVVPDYVSGARQEVDLMKARRDLDRMRREANRKRAR